MQSTAKVIEDSIFRESRLVTIQLRYPRFIHSELMTHRVFSRNASSSRAVPAKKIWAQITEAPAMPVVWGLNEPGMQASKIAEGELAAQMEALWREAATAAVGFAQRMDALGAHKQIVNRITEPYSYIQVVVTSSYWSNFFELRNHPDADPTFQELAQTMETAIYASKPKELKPNRGFHLPYIREHEKATFNLEGQVKCSVARCARVSYLLHDGNETNPEKDFELYERLVGGKPLHASPLEHQARTLPRIGKNGNFDENWAQYRKFVEDNDAKGFWA